MAPEATADDATEDRDEESKKEGSNECGDPARSVEEGLRDVWDGCLECVLGCRILDAVLFIDDLD